MLGDRRVNASAPGNERQFAMIALQDLEEASANGDGRLFWYSIQNALVAVGRISRLLWPPTLSSRNGEPS